MSQSQAVTQSFRRLVLAAWLGAYGGWPGLAAEEPKKLVFQSVQDLQSPVKPQVINGQPASAKDWPATFLFRNSDGAGCTATAVGKRVLLVAAHCIEDGAVGTAELGDFVTDVRCNRHPNYPDDISADFTLCVAADGIPMPSEGTFETINTTDPGTPQINQQVTLLGYGCRTVGGGDASFGSLYKGNAAVLRRETNLYAVTSGGAAVCFGDSGGGAYVAAKVGVPIGQLRRLWGVNSRGDISQNSWIATTANPVFVTWATQWANQNSVQICGLNGAGQECRP